jgi:hypothetical protein
MLAAISSSREQKLNATKAFLREAAPPASDGTYWGTKHTKRPVAQSPASILLRVDDFHAGSESNLPTAPSYAGDERRAATLRCAPCGSRVRAAGRDGDARSRVLRRAHGQN